MSMCHCHNETLNIWTHFLGVAIFVSLTVYTIPIVSPAGAANVIVFAVFLASAITCLTFSTIFHLLLCVSHKTAIWFAKLDYSGISILIVGSFFPPIYYGFKCRVSLARVYLTLISVLGILTTVVMFFERFSTKRYRPLRAGLFVALGTTGIAPLLHFMISVGFDNDFTRTVVVYLVAMAVLYLSGALLYATRVPERFMPGKFDYFVPPPLAV